MPETFAVYVPASGRGLRNLRTGLSAQSWGWKLGLGAKHLDTVRNLLPGDGLILASGGPSPRVPAGGWSDVKFQQFYIAELTEGHFIGNSPVWQDETESDSVIYPERIKFGLSAESTTPEKTSPEVAEALRMSANTKGAPILVGDANPEQPTSISGSQPRFPVADLDVDRLVKKRREQSTLRKHLFGGG